VTRRARRLAGCVLATLALALVGSACGNERVAGMAGTRIEQLPADFVPSELQGLPVAQEDMTDTVARSKDAFIESVGMYSMRRDDLLQATLQVSKFTENAPVDRPGFRSSLVSQVGGRRVQSYRMGTSTVYRTTGRKQVVSLWFKDRHMFVLSVRDTYETPRSLLREALAIDPA
jgi:hypothetical protein